MNKRLKLMIGTGLVILLSYSTATVADTRTAKVRLVATINNAPAFQPIKWEVFRLDDYQKIDTTTHRHTFTLTPLPPGRYKAIAQRRGGESRERDFYVTADTTNRVYIPVD